MFGNTTFSGSASFANRLDANRESLLFVIEQYFHPKVICAERGGTCGRIGDTIRFLKRNLEREEQLMELSGYPGLADHRRDHQTALQKLEKLRATLVCSHYDNGLVFDFLERWADNHSRVFDRPFGDFLQSRAKA